MAGRIFRHFVVPAMVGAGALVLYQQLQRSVPAAETSCDGDEDEGVIADATTDINDEHRRLVDVVQAQAVEITKLRALLALLDAHARSNAQPSPVLSLLREASGVRTVEFEFDREKKNPFSPLHVREATSPVFQRPVARIAATLDFG